MTKMISDLSGRTEIVCNSCGSEQSHYEEHIHIKHSFGYGTLLDTSDINIHICENCMVDFLKKCKFVGIEEGVLPQDEFIKQYGL